MNKHEDIANALKSRLSELTGRVAEIDSELRERGADIGLVLARDGLSAFDPNATN